MSRKRPGVLTYLALILGIGLVFALVYDVGMTVFEGRPRSFLESLEIVVEAFTTTGFGSDAPWRSVGMQLIVIFMQLTGVLLIFLALPLFVAPWAEDKLRTSVPSTTDLEDHVILCGLSSKGETLIEELETWDREYVIVEPDYDRSRRLLQSGLSVINGNPESIDDLTNANVADASVVVADATDEENASIVLSVQEVSDTPVIAVVEEPGMKEYLSYAGADEVYSPRQLLGESLANEVTAAVSTELGDTVTVGDDFEVAELPLRPGSPLVGSVLGNSGIREETGANVVALWQGEEFIATPGPESLLTENTTLLVAGTEDQLAALKQLTLSDVLHRARGRVIVAGHGEVGETVRRRIAESEMTGVVVDKDPSPSVDFVGDAREATTLETAGVDQAEALVLALGDDTATMLATLVARELTEDLRIVARVDARENVAKVRRAGADYVLALDTVSGRMIASGVLEEDVIAPEARVEIIRTVAPALTGHTLEGADIRSQTGCTVIAVEREGSVLTDLGPDFTFEDDDSLVVAGPDDAVNRFSTYATEDGT